MDQFRDFFDDGGENLVKLYERMLKKGEEMFFDNEEFEMIIDHYMAFNSLNKALQVADKAIEQHPYDVNFLNRKAQLFYFMHNFRYGLKILDEAESLEPTNYEVYLLRSLIYEKLNKTDLTIQNYQHAEELAYRDVEFYMLEAHIRSSKEEFSRAIDALQKALKINPVNEQAFSDLIITADLGNERKKAIAFYETMTDEMPYNPRVWYNLGSLYRTFNKHEKALWALDYAILIKPDFLDAIEKMADYNMEIEQYEEALKHFYKYLELNEGNGTLFYKIGFCLVEVNRFDEARKYFQLALKDDEWFAHAWHGYGMTFYREGKVKKAVNYFKKSLRCDEQYDQALHSLADCYAHLGYYDECIDMYEKVIDEDPLNEAVWLDYSRFLLSYDKLDETVRVLEEGITLNPDYSKLYYLLAGVLFNNKKIKKALSSLDKAIDLNINQFDIIYDFFPELIYDSSFDVMLCLLGDKAPDEEEDEEEDEE